MSVQTYEWNIQILKIKYSCQLCHIFVKSGEGCLEARFRVPPRQFQGETNSSWKNENQKTLLPETAMTKNKRVCTKK